MNVLIPIQIEGLGEQIRAARQRVFPDKPLRWVAKRANVPPPCLARIENGEQGAVNLQTLLRIQQALGETWIDEGVASSISI